MNHDIRRTKFFKPIGALLTLAMLSCFSCMSAMIAGSVKSGIENTAIGGEFLIHDNAKVGDYAVYRRILQSSNVVMNKTIDIASVFTDRYEIVSADDTGFVVRHTPEAESIETFVNGKPGRRSTKAELLEMTGQAVMEYHLDIKGKIRKVTYKNTKLGIDTMHKTALEGQDGYIKYQPVNEPLIIKTDAGMFKTKPLAYTMKNTTVMKSAAVSGEVSSINANITYVSNDVKFKKVTSVTMFVSDGSLTNELAKKAMGITKMLSVTKFVLNPALIISDSKNIFEFAKNNVIPGKEDALDKFLATDEMAFKNMKGSSVEILMAQGRK